MSCCTSRDNIFDFNALAISLPSSSTTTNCKAGVMKSTAAMKIGSIHHLWSCCAVLIYECNEKRCSLAVEVIVNVMQYFIFE